MRILDPEASLRTINRELKATGLDVRVVKKPVSPSLVGEWIGGTSPYWNVMLDIDDTDGANALLRRTSKRTELVVGRAAEPGEPYFAARSPFCPAETLGGLGIEDLPPPDAKLALQARGFSTSWRAHRTLKVETGHVAGSDEAVADPPVGVITRAIATSSNWIVVFVSLPDDYAAAHRSVYEGCA